MKSKSLKTNWTRIIPLLFIPVFMLYCSEDDNTALHIEGNVWDDSNGSPISGAGVYLSQAE